MSKTSMALPSELIEALKESARESGFKSWAEQARYELMSPRGLWPTVKPVMPSRQAPTHGVGQAKTETDNE